MRRFLCLYFPQWPLQCLYQAHPDLRGKPIALFKRFAHGPALLRCSAEAMKLGVKRGMPLAEARALSPEIQVFESDPESDRGALEEMALWAGRFSPLAGVETTYSAPLPDAALPLKTAPELASAGEKRLQKEQEAQSLLLDITGCELCFNGEENLLQQVRQALAKRKTTPLKVRTAIAPTIGAAWALAHYGASGTIIPDPDNDRDRSSLTCALGPLPLRCLRMEPDALAWLNKLGLHRVEELIEQPRETLPARFGAGLLERLDQALGRAPEMIPLLRPPPEIFAASAFDYPVNNMEALFPVIEKLLSRVTGELQQRCRGARELECWLYHEASGPVCAAVTLFKGSASQAHLVQLLRTRLDDLALHLGKRQNSRHQSEHHLHLVHLEIEENICAVGVHITASEPLDIEQNHLFQGRTESRASATLALTLDRIRTRLGASTVLQAACVPDAQPEYAVKFEPIGERTLRETEPMPEREAAWACAESSRPVTLLPHPEPVTVEWPDQSPKPLSFQRQKTGAGKVPVSGVSGPERIETGWWRESYTRRDYYVVDSGDGGRYWLFRRLDGDDENVWFLHGLFD